MYLQIQQEEIIRQSNVIKVDENASIRNYEFQGLMIWVQK
jgi:hypothetical protein